MTNPGRARGGRQARQAQRSGAAGSPAVIPGIRRAIPTYDLMGEEGLDRIEAAIDTLLQEIGIEFRGDPPALKLWHEAGADVQGDRVRFPVGLVREIILRSTPKSFVHHARNPARSVTVGGSNVVFSPAYGSPFVHDIDEGRR